MFCGNCGQPIDEQDKFCRSCGAKDGRGASAPPPVPSVPPPVPSIPPPVSSVPPPVSSVPPPVPSIPSYSPIPSVSPSVQPVPSYSPEYVLEHDSDFYGAVAASIAMVILLLMGWVQIEINPYISELFGVKPSSLSIFKIFSTLREMDEYARGALTGSIIYALILVVLCAVTLLVLGIYTYRLFTDPIGSMRIGGIAMNFVIALCVAFFIAILYTNVVLSDVSDPGSKIIRTLAKLSITFAPYAALGTAFLCKFVFVKNVNKKIMRMYDQPRQTSKAAVYSQINSINTVACQNCGYKYGHSQNSCPRCGYRRN